MAATAIFALLALPAALAAGAGGVGAFFLFEAHRSRDPDLITHAAFGLAKLSAALAALTIVATALLSMAGLAPGFGAPAVQLVLLSGAMDLVTGFNAMRLRALAENSARAHRPLHEAYGLLFHLTLAGAIAAALLAGAGAWLALRPA